MAYATRDEEIPLLSDRNSQTLLPWLQLGIVFLFYATESLTTSIIYPLAPQLVRDLGITHGDEKKVGYYVGFLESSFYASQALTIVGWSKLSDKLGRKPILIATLFGASFSLWSFGLSTTYRAAVITRCITGAFSVNSGVIKSAIVDLTDSTNVVEAFAYLRIVWFVGGVVGPFIGGGLSRPAIQFPNIFGNIQLLKDYPYLLPCSLPVLFALFAILIGWVALKETVSNPLPVKTLFGMSALSSSRVNYRESPQTCHEDISMKQRPLRHLLTFPVLIATLNYSMVALVDMTYRALMPVFFSTPISLGGLGFSPALIGMSLSAYGVASGLFQTFYFARIHRRFGGKNVLMFSVALAVPIFALFPLMSEWVKLYDSVTPGVWVMIIFHFILRIAFDLSYACIFIYVASAAPDEHSIGAATGIAQMSVSLMRSFGPSLSTSLYSLSMEGNYMGGWLVWWVMMGLAAGGVGSVTLLPKEAWKRPGGR